MEGIQRLSRVFQVPMLWKPAFRAAKREIRASVSKVQIPVRVPPKSISSAFHLNVSGFLLFQDDPAAQVMCIGGRTIDIFAQLIA